MLILVSGGAGFIGSHTVKQLVAAGHQVRVLDDLSSGGRANLPFEVDLVVGDVTDQAVVEAASRGCQAILHLAALVSVPQSLQQPVLTYQVNTTGTLLLLEAARKHGIQRFVLASTCAVYGNADGTLDELIPTRPLVPYATSKLTAEAWVQSYSQCYGITGAILRYFNVYGPGQRADSAYSGVLARWRAAIQAEQECVVFGDGSQTRDFISVHDVAQANLLALTSPQVSAGVPMNVATGQATSLNDILLTLRQVAEVPVRWRYEPPRSGDIQHSCGNSQRLQRLGWKPHHTLKQGLTELLTTA
jgi:UDP-glucose 4-epimerase